MAPGKEVYVAGQGPHMRVAYMCQRGCQQRAGGIGSQGRSGYGWGIHPTSPFDLSHHNKDLIGG